MDERHIANKREQIVRSFSQTKLTTRMSIERFSIFSHLGVKNRLQGKQHPL